MISDLMAGWKHKLGGSARIMAIFVLVTGIEPATASGFVQTLGSQLTQSGQDSNYVQGEVLVKFRPGVSRQTQGLTAANLGGRAYTAVGKQLNTARVRLATGIDVATAIDAFRSDPAVEHVQPNYIYQAALTPNDTNYGELWGLNNSGQTITNPAYSTNNPGIAGSDIDAESAWDEITDCRAVVVAVLDTGINYTHTDLAANMWDGSGAGFPNHGFDFVDNDNDPLAEGGQNHGTHVAGTIGAVGNNALGVTGVCWQASIMSVRVLGPFGGTTADIVSGIEFASDNGAGVINMSLSGEFPLDQLYSDAITYARNADVVVVVAAGNGGPDGLSDDNDGLGGDGNAGTATQPCNFDHDNLICVAALDQDYQLSVFSNFGVRSVDVGAPGTNTLSSVAGQTLTDDFASGWTLGGAWTRSQGICSSFPILTNPANYCLGGPYADGIDHRAYKTFDLSGTSALKVAMNYFAQVDTEPGFDFLSAGMNSAGGDPFAGGVLLANGSGSTGGLLFGFNHDISSCRTVTCSLGFRLTSNGSISSRGAAIADFSIGITLANSTDYQVFNGTSMASPHVAGIAAMVRAFNPGYTYAETIEAVLNGGESTGALAGVTRSGNAANAMGAISHITVPAGLTAIVQ